MDNRTNLINEEKNILFKDFVNVIELSDITESKDGTFLFTLKHRVHVALLNNIFADNLGTSTSKYNT